MEFQDGEELENCHSRRLSAEQRDYFIHAQADLAQVCYLARMILATSVMSASVIWPLPSMSALFFLNFAEG